MFQKKIMVMLLVSLLGALTACSQEESVVIEEYPIEDDSLTENSTGVDGGTAKEESLGQNTETLESEEAMSDKEEDTRTAEEKARAAEMKDMFGENCIPEQTFEVELSEYDGKVYFVSYKPAGEDTQLRMQIVRDGEVMDTIHAYVPESLEHEAFTSLDAVSFFDANFDDCTDIVCIQTYGDTTFAAVYYGFLKGAGEYEDSFYSEYDLSDVITAQVEELTIPNIRSFLTQGKKNGEFTDYKEAYAAKVRLCAMETTSEMTYDLIYVDEDDVPELAAGVDGYYVSLYTYKDGSVYTLMDRWAYGAMGNSGYEYSPKNNNLRNYNTDHAGLILYTTYMTISEEQTLDILASIKTFNFDDANQNGYPDEEEMGSVGEYGVSYINGVEATDKECQSYDAGEYEYISGEAGYEEFVEMLASY